MHRRSVEAVREYWNTHPLGKQYASPSGAEIGTAEFFDEIRPG